MYNDVTLVNDDVQVWRVLILRHVLFRMFLMSGTFQSQDF